MQGPSAPIRGSRDAHAHALRSAATIAGLLVAGVGAVALLGWVLDDAALKSIFAGEIVVKTNAAIGLLLAGSALVLLTPEDKGATRRRIGRLCASIVVAIGLATLAEHLFRVDLGIDQALFVEPPGGPATASPNRMGPLPSILFLLLGCALFFLDRTTRRGRMPAQRLAVTAGLIALLPILGYLFGVHELFGLAQYTGIALHTALALAILSLGILAARPDVGFARLFLANDPGGVLLRRMLPVAVLLPIALGWLRVEAQRREHITSEFGTSLSALAYIAIFGAIVCWNARVLSRMAHERARAHAIESELKDRLVAILDHIAQGFYALDRDRRFTYVNREGERLAGTSHTELVGRNLDACFPAGRFSALHAAIERALASDANELVLLFDETLARWHEHDVVPSADGFSLFVRDVTESKNREEERRTLLESERAARTDAERASRTKDEFLATLSHELRTPLNAILGWSQLLARGSISAHDLEKGLETIERNARMQAQLIEDLLDLSRITSGKIRLDVRSVDLAEVVETALLTANPGADAKGIAVGLRLDRGAGTVRGDPERLQQVMWNLLSNAIKFTPQGGRIDVALERVEGHVEVRVRDTGIGIKPEFLPFVFERFRQADGSTTRRHGGLGIGLSIARQLCELHGGSLHAESAGDGAGSTFTVRLPIEVGAGGASGHARGQPSVDSAATTFLEPPSLAGVRVLVVDDQADVREMLRRMLSEREAQVVVAEGADEGLRLLDGATFDVLVSDIGMPGRDGYDLIRAVRARADERGGRVPAIALTAFARAEDRERTLQAGYQIHVAKPVQHALLVAAIASLAERIAPATGA